MRQTCVQGTGCDTRIRERLRDEHGFEGGETIVKDYVREHRRRRREMFVPLAHPPGHAQADFGEAKAYIAGVEGKIHFFVMALPHSDRCFVKAYPAATTVAWLDGHVCAFAFFGGVPRSILYDNDKRLVARILKDGTRQRTQDFSKLQSHYLFEDRYGRPGKGNDKVKVEGMVGLARRNFMVPIPRVESWDAFNADLAAHCRRRGTDILRGHRESIEERFVRDQDALMAPPSVAPDLARQPDDSTASPNTYIPHTPIPVQPNLYLSPCAVLRTTWKQNGAYTVPGQNRVLCHKRKSPPSYWNSGDYLVAGVGFEPTTFRL